MNAPFSPDDLDRVRAGVARERDRRLGEAAVARGWITREQMGESLKQLISPGQLEELVRERRGSDASAFFAGGAPELPEEARPFERDPSRNFHNYLLVEEIGKGGMGRVWKAWDRALHRWVALKVLHDGTPEAARPRFLREARAAARVKHPHLVTVFDAGQHDQKPYLVMELVEGQPLPVRSGLKEVVQILRKVALALEEAHQQGVVHRDLKPGNILVDARGEPHVVDFGLAHLTDSDLRLTRSGTAIGTPLYMAPEQVAGTPEIGPRTDVYAMGVMLYEAMVGRPPHLGDSASVVYERILREDPIPPEGPRDLVTICQKALEKEPARRYASAAAFAEDLRRWSDGEPIAAHPPSLLYRMRKRIRRYRAAGAVVAVLLVAAVAGSMGWRVLEVTARDRDTLKRMKPFDEAIRQARLTCYITGGDIRGELDRLEAQLAQLERLAEDPAFARYGGTWTTLGIGWYVAGDGVRAEAALLKARAIGHEEGWVSFTLGRIYLERTATETISSARDDFDLRRKMSRLSVKRAWEELMRPRDAWANAGVIERDLVHGYELLVSAEGGELEAHCDACLAHYGDLVGTEELWLLKGWAALDGGKADAALAPLGKALERRPHYPLARFFRGNAHSARKKWKEAITDYEEAVRLNPRWSAAWANLGAARYQDDEPRAMEALDRAIAIDFDNASAHYVRGQVRAQKRDAKGALADYDEVLRLHPDHENALRRRGGVKLFLDDKKGAAADWKKALDVAPSNWPKRDEVQRELDKLAPREH